VVLGGSEADHGVGLEQLGAGHQFGLVTGIIDQVAVLIVPVNLK